MIIESISIRHFGMLHDCELRMGKGLNVIEGSNESGKSTLAAFIRFMLYGFTDTDDRDRLPGEPDERHRRISWQSGTAEGSMVVFANGKHYRIERYSALNTIAGQEVSTDRGSIMDLETGAVVSRKSAGEYFFAISPEVFCNTAYIGQLADI